MDLLVCGCLVVEHKAVDVLLAVHVSQVVAYLRTTNLVLGLLINFNVTRVRDGIKRVISSPAAQTT